MLVISFDIAAINVKKIIGHNMKRPQPDPRFIEAITTNPALDSLFFHMDAAGIAVSLKKK